MRDSVMVPRRLTAENGGKALMIGEFFETVEQPCQYEICTTDDCPLCGGSGVVQFVVPVSWTTIKAIYARAVDHFTSLPEYAEGSRDVW